MVILHLVGPADNPEVMSRFVGAPSDYCCLGSGCKKPEFCDAFGWSCGDPTAPHGEAFVARLKEMERAQ